MDKTQRFEELCEQIRSGNNKVALEAVDMLRGNGWLTDGSLHEANLSSADLVKVNLRETDLCKVNLSEANLRRAVLTRANLTEANLSQAVLRRAILSDAVLENTLFCGATLHGAVLRRAAMSRAILSKANLREVVLRRADLREANLSGADLTGADLSEADLTGANLSQAVLRKSDLTGVNLALANLVSTNLQEAILTKTVLRGADFTDATLGVNILADIDFSETRGLESVRHIGPSHISTDTFYKSKGTIPVAFLKGCGVPDDYIEYILPLTGKVIEFYSCFISYSHAQKEFAQRLHDRLQGASIRCWLDEHQVKPGQDIYEEVNRGIRLWDKVLLCCSEASLTSWWVDNEIKTALEKEQQLTKERSKRVRAIIPLNIDGYLFSGEWESGYEAQIRSRLAADFTNWKDHDAFEVEFQKVLAALRTDEGREEPPVSGFRNSTPL